MNYISDCCSAPAVAESLNTWNDYSNDSDDVTVVTYGTFSECYEHSLFSEGE